MEHHTTTSRAEAERLLGIAEKLLREKDYNPCKDFALLAQETEPLLEGPDQILAIAEVLLASQKRINNHHDWYSILQISDRTDDSELIKKQYRRLALLLHPDKNKYPSSDAAFGFVADAWAVLSDPSKKTPFDNEFSLFKKINLVAKKQTYGGGKQQQKQQRKKEGKLPVRRSTRERVSHSNSSSQNQENVSNYSARASMANQPRRQRVVKFWTTCPYCYNLYQYPRVYEGCCLRCDGCNRSFTAAEIVSMPPLVPGREAYYCIWGFFPMGFVNGNVEGGKSSAAAGFPNWMPPMFPSGGVSGGSVGGGSGGREGFVNVGNQNATAIPVPAPTPTSAPPPRPKPVSVSTGGKKRGRPRKYA